MTDNVRHDISHWRAEGTGESSWSCSCDGIVRSGYTRPRRALLDAYLHAEGDSLRRALKEAEVWSEGGYSSESRAYWQGMRDTLRVVLGLTTERPTSTGPGTDVAATVILRPEL